MSEYKEMPFPEKDGSYLWKFEELDPDTTITIKNGKAYIDTIVPVVAYGGFWKEIIEDDASEEFIVLHIVLYFDVNEGFSSSVYLNEDDANNCKGYGNYIGSKRVELPYKLWEKYCNDTNSSGE